MMKQREPALVPEWYKGSTGSASATGNSNNRSRSSLCSDEHGVEHPSRNRFSASSCDLDAPYSSAFSDGSLSSFRRSVSSNGFLTHDRVSASNSRRYSSFSRSHRHKDREKDHNLRERSRSFFVENGFSNYTDSNLVSRNERGILRHTPSLVGRHGEALSKRPSSDLSNGVMTGASTISSIGRHSFEREFPSLGVEDRQPEIARVSSPGLTIALGNLPQISPAAIGGDGWASALAGVPVRVGGINGPTTSSATSTALSSTTGLNMAETLAQAPVHARTASQESVDTQKIEELTRLQYGKLIPMTPSMPKSMALNSLEKSKVKGARSGECSVPSKVGLHSSSQLASHTLRAPSRSDVVKTSQAGNLHLFNREKNNSSPIVRDGLNLRNASKVVASHGGLPMVVSPPPKSPAQTSSGEKRPNSLAQKRNDFFNVIRQQAPLNHSLDPPDPRSVSQEKEKESRASCFGLEHSMESDNGATGDVNVASEEPNRSILNSEDEISSSDPVIARLLPDNKEESLPSNPVVLKCVSSSVDETLKLGPAFISKTISLTVRGDVGSSPDSVITESVPENVDEKSFDPVPVPSEEEAAFLQSLGWDENADIHCLTLEEIGQFYQKHPELKASSRLCHLNNH